MTRLIASPRVSSKDLVGDRAFWANLVDLRTRLNLLQPHTAGGYGNRRFAIIRNAAWITLYRAVSPYPQIGVFLRCTGLAGEAFFAIADVARERIEPHLQAVVGPGALLEWGTTHHPGMTDIAAVIAAPFPWNTAAASLHIAWLLQAGAAFWTAFGSLANGAQATQF